MALGNAAKTNKQTKNRKKFSCISPKAETREILSLKFNIQYNHQGNIEQAAPQESGK